MKNLFLFTFLLFNLVAISQKTRVFNGELLYEIERVSPKDSLPGKMLIYAKDSLQRVINFSSSIGKQEVIKHLRLNRSYVLVTTTKGDFAIKTDQNINKDTVESYTFKKKFGKKRIAGIKAKRVSVSLRGVENKFTFYYHPKIDAKYSNAYHKLPGLALEYFVVSDNTLFKYTLISIKNSEPPLSLFMIPENYKKVSIEEFMKEVSAQ